MSFNTPILLLAFNRPDTTARVFEKIREMQPSHLYIAADGPRPDNVAEKIKCERVREIVTAVDWPCEIRTLFRESNLGCKRAVSEGIDWFFSNVQEGIILEDDTLPSNSFFLFAQEMLARYRDNKRVMHVSAFNIANTWRHQHQSYHFSRFGTIWGWATWNRSWKLYDVNIRQWRHENVQQQLLKKYFPKKYRASRKQIYDRLYNGEIDTWDYQWTFARLLHDGLSIVPSQNLIVNIGFDSAATHTQNAPEWAPKKSFELSFPLAESAVRVDAAYDAFHLEVTGQSQPNFFRQLQSRSTNVFRAFFKKFDS